MFQRELQSTLGADYMDRTQRNRNTGKKRKGGNTTDCV